MNTFPRFLLGRRLRIWPLLALGVVCTFGTNCTSRKAAQQQEKERQAWEARSCLPEI